jgi:hypothetical protein
MRSAWHVVSVACLSLALLVVGAHAKIPTDNLIGLWLLDDGKGDVAKDSSGKKTDGKLINGPEWAKGKFEWALKFEANKLQRVEVPDAEHLNPTKQITITAWGYLSAPFGNHRFLQKSTPGSDNQYRLLLEWGTFKFDAGPGVNPKEVTTAVFSSDEWHHVAGTYDGKEIVLYIDGERKAGMAAQGDMAPAVGGPVFIGTKHPNAPAGDYWNGMIDEVAIFNKGLTADEVKDVMAGFTKGLAVSNRGKLATRWARMKTP